MSVLLIYLISQSVDFASSFLRLTAYQSPIIRVVLQISIEIKGNPWSTTGGCYRTSVHLR